MWRISVGFVLRAEWPLPGVLGVGLVVVLIVVFRARVCCRRDIPQRLLVFVGIGEVLELAIIGVDLREPQFLEREDCGVG